MSLETITSAIVKYVAHQLKRPLMKHENQRIKSIVASLKFPSSDDKKLAKACKLVAEHLLKRFRDDKSFVEGVESVEEFMQKTIMTSDRPESSIAMAAKEKEKEQIPLHITMSIIPKSDLKRTYLYLSTEFAKFSANNFYRTWKINSIETKEDETARILHDAGRIHYIRLYPFPWLIDLAGFGADNSIENRFERVTICMEEFSSVAAILSSGRKYHWYYKTQRDIIPSGEGLDSNAYIYVECFPSGEGMDLFHFPEPVNLRTLTMSVGVPSDLRAVEMDFHMEIFYQSDE